MSYSIVYADPPWSFGNRMYSSNKNDHHREISRAYDVMSTADICALNVKDITADDCVLFMWTTDAHIPDALEVMKAWGFKYKTVAFTWVKQNKKADSYFMGLGYWTRANPEICLLATRGNPKRIDKSVPNLVVSRLREHSRKPDVIRDRIVKLCGDLPRIELFARECPQGWDVWGNEVPLTEQQEGGNGLPPTDKSVGIRPTIL